MVGNDDLHSVGFRLSYVNLYDFSAYHMPSYCIQQGANYLILKMNYL
jgi:hypothetical protein